MSQLSLHSVSIGQNTDNKVNNIGASIKKPTSDTTFSNVIEQHNQEQKLEPTNKKIKDQPAIGNNSPEVTYASPVPLASEHESIEKIKGKIKLPENAHTLPVPIAPELESVEKTQGLIKSPEDARILPVPITPELESAEKTTGKAKLPEDAHTLPVPIIPELEPAEKTTGKTKLPEDTHTLPIPIIPELEKAEKTKSKIKLPEDAHTLPVPITPELEPAEKTKNKTKLPEDAHILPVPITPELESAEKTTGKIKPPEEAYTLPVPIVPELESAEKITGKIKQPADAHTLPVPIVPELESAEKITGKIKLPEDVHTLPVPVVAEIESEIKAPHDGYLLPVPILAETESTKLDSSNAEVVNLLKMLSGAQKLLTQADDENVVVKLDEKNKTDNVESVKQNVTTSQVLQNDQTLKSDALTNNALKDKQESIESLSKNTVGLAAEQSIDDKKNVTLAREGKSLTSDNVQSNVASNNANELIPDEVLIESETVGNRYATTISHLDNDKNVSLENKEKLAEETLVQANKNAQENNALKNAAFAGVDNNNSQNASNQTTANAVIMPDGVKAQSNSSMLAEKNAKNSGDVVDKNTDKSSEEISLAKVNAEKISPMVEKTVSMVNQIVEAQTGRPTMSLAEMAMQQEHSFESAMSKLNTDKVQTQKSITALNTETIAIYRKDLANVVKDKVMVMINQRIQQVEIQLDPPEMGNVHVRVNLQNEQAAVQFVVQNQQAKEALEQNIGKLRDMLAENGVDVGDANIEQRQPGEQSKTAFEEQASSGKNGQGSEQELGESHQQQGNMVKASSTGVDYYA
jgi:flagellar hook-length control protein FliK